MKHLLRRALDISEILAWADTYHEATGRWPTKSSGGIAPTKFETWSCVDTALRSGLRGLPGGSSLAQLLAEKRGVRNIKGLPPLTEDQILQWADNYHMSTGLWPTAQSGKIPDCKGETWSAVNVALKLGSRGLSGGTSLPQLLDQHRGVRNRKDLPPLTEEQILVWADAHHQRTGSWPNAKSGAIIDAPGETWLAVQVALSHGQRGLPGGTSLARLLAEARGVANKLSRPHLSVTNILAWADGFHARTGTWPNLNSGAILEAPGEKWIGIDRALKRNLRGLKQCCSLAALLAAERGVRNKVSVPRLCRKRILVWARAHFRSTGKWPTTTSGPILEAPEETWAAVDTALQNGLRGLQAGSSLARLLAKHGMKPNHLDMLPLSKKKILAWADAHHQRTGQWPNTNSGSVAEAPSERWDLIDNALRLGQRGLAGGSSLLRLLTKKRGVRNPLTLPPLTEDVILQWAKSHLARTGSWPKYRSGPITDAPGETWAGVDSALRLGKRGLPSGSSLAKLLAGYGNGLELAEVNSDGREIMAESFHELDQFGAVPQTDEVRPPRHPI